ncbi:MAG: DUF2550 family protein [Micromonosporaceae bacterium]|nr:DUF2550 family protein [Micromonosporaceae bacterium]
MKILEWIAIGALLLVLALGSLFLRRWLLARPGTIELYLRLSTLIEGRGWAPGFARLAGDQLRWYRMFSFAVRPRRVLSRRTLTVESRRPPTGSERFSLPEDWVILRCTSHHAPVELAMAPGTLTGFLSWIEASPPGTVSLYSFPPSAE